MVHGSTGPVAMVSEGKKKWKRVQSSGIGNPRRGEAQGIFRLGKKKSKMQKLSNDDRMTADSQAEKKNTKGRQDGTGIYWVLSFRMRNG